VAIGSIFEKNSPVNDSEHNIIKGIISVKIIKAIMQINVTIILVYFDKYHQS